MASVTDICNLALGLLGEPPISDIDDTDSKAAMYCRQFYGQCRDALLMKHTWPCAIKRATLQQCSAAPEFEYAYAYTLPADYLRMLHPEEKTLQYAIEYDADGIRVLVCNSDEVRIKYLAKITEPGRFDALFVDALAASLAARIAYPITGNSDLVKFLSGLEAEAGERAEGMTRNDDQEDHLDAQSDSWLTARGGSNQCPYIQS
jgi:hypothetical protein